MTLDEEIRALGWALWDPIGLAKLDGGWRGRPYEDEYDRYLTEACDRLARGISAEEIVSYLVWVERERMGLRRRTDAKERASALVAALVQRR
ncbi:MAG: hypothetical protein AAGF13_05805 [Pseudomonadota bacterium]